MMKRIANTSESAIDMHFKAPVLKADKKPRGLWYALDDSWVKWLQSGTTGLSMHPNNFHVDIDESRILKLETSDDFLKFEHKYKAEESDRGVQSIDWPRIARDWAGIEIGAEVIASHRGFGWFDGWDVASGCLWDSTALLKATKLEQETSGNRFKAGDSITPLNAPPRR